MLTVAVMSCGWPTCTLAADGMTLTATAAVTVIVATPVFVPSASEVAVSVTVAGPGVVAGAVYVIAAPEALELAERVPHVAPEQPVPDNAQLTPLFCVSLVTVAVNALVPILV